MDNLIEGKNIPELRFPGFTGEWEEKKLGEILKVKHGKSQKNVENINGNYPILGTGGVIGKSSKYLYNKESVLIGRKGTIDRPIYINEPFWTIDTLFYTDIDIENYIPFYIYLQFSRINWYKYNEASGVPSLSAKTIESITIDIPSFLEQQKISSFFYTFDQKLDLQKKRIEELKTYKKGMMQRIFSQEIRFKDENGQDYPDWEEKRLGEISKITTGKLDANAMVDNGKYRFYTCAKEYYRIDNYAFDTEALLISGNGANVGYIHYYNGKFNAYQRTYVLDSFKEHIIYIKYFLNANLKKRIDQTKNAGNTPYITLGTLSDMRISLPSLPEQKKIASFLSNLDRRIELEEERLEAYEEFKKGLMQRMFV